MFESDLRVVGLPDDFEPVTSRHGEHVVPGWDDISTVRHDQFRCRVSDIGSVEPKPDVDFLSGSTASSVVYLCGELDVVGSVELECDFGAGHDRHTVRFRCRVQRHRSRRIQGGSLIYVGVEHAVVAESTTSTLRPDIALRSLWTLDTLWPLDTWRSSDSDFEDDGAVVLDNELCWEFG